MRNGERIDSIGGGGWGGGEGCERTPLAGQIISKSPEFTPLILATKSEFS